MYFAVEKKKKKEKKSAREITAPICRMGLIRNPRWEQKWTEGYVIVSICSVHGWRRCFNYLYSLNYSKEVCLQWQKLD